MKYAKMKARHLVCVMLLVMVLGGLVMAIVRYVARVEVGLWKNGWWGGLWEKGWTDIVRFWFVWFRFAYGWWTSAVRCTLCGRV